MTDLTQDWKDSKLSAGWYYVQFPNSEIKICSAYELYRYILTIDFDKFKILAEVSDYNIWQNLWNTAEVEHKANNKLLETMERLERQVNHLSKTQAQRLLTH